jgi:hypothetical protein
MSKIDLGHTLDDMISVTPMGKNEKHYPTLHISEVSDRRLAEMPDEGEMTIKYKIRERTHSERKEKGEKKHACSVTLDVTSIDPPAAKSKKRNGDSDGGARKAMSDYFKDK